MPIAHFPSLVDADIVEVSFVGTQGSDLTYQLLVDTGFTGSSSFVLGKEIGDLFAVPVFSGYAFGAIQGVQQRATVHCRIPALSFQATALVILADLAPLGLPTGVQGLVGMRFLRQFHRWGAEKLNDGSWRFYLEK